MVNPCLTVITRLILIPLKRWRWWKSAVGRRSARILYGLIDAAAVEIGDIGHPMIEHRLIVRLFLLFPYTRCTEGLKDRTRGTLRPEANRFPRFLVVQITVIKEPHG